MTARDREWLRTFLHLGKRADGDGAVLARDIERQEDTVLRALSLLEEQPGVVLADEVGMGKTYEALGVLAARQHDDPERRALILTPGPDLNTKWRKELVGFCDPQRPMYGKFADRFETATSLAELVRVFEEKTIAIAPVTIFAGSRSQADQAYLLSLWARGQGLAGNRAAALFRRYGDGSLERVDVESRSFLGAFGWDRVGPIQEAVLRDHQAKLGDASLHQRFAENGYSVFEKKQLVDHALADLRFRLVGKLLPALDLLIVDEAHKLKNAESVRATGVRVAFDGVFDKALFLTATPFQLSVEELRELFALFARARSAPSDIEARAQALLDDVRTYTEAYDDFERAWAGLDPAMVEEFARWFDEDPTLSKEPADPVLAAIGAPARRLLALKREKIAPGFQRWMIRSIREDKRLYRRSVRTRLRPAPGQGVPFLLYERFIAELFRSSSRTHKAAVQINMVSSYGAAREGAILDAEVKANLTEEAERYRRLLRRVVQADQTGHPKVDHVVKVAVEAAERDEKTLIFCARRETLKQLRTQIHGEWEARMVSRWTEVFPGARAEDIFDRKDEEGRSTTGRHSHFSDRFQGADSCMFLAMRGERYVSTLLRACDFARENLADIVARANGFLASQATNDPGRKDWPLLKRCVEQATAQALRDAGGHREVDPDSLARLLDPSFVALGYDLEEDDVEIAPSGSERARWEIQEADAELVIAPRHLWSSLTAQLSGIPPKLRVRTVERLAAYLVSRHVAFLPDLLGHVMQTRGSVEGIEGRELLPLVDAFWTTDRGRPWRERIARFLAYAENQTDERRKEILDEAIRPGAIVRHTVDGETRERLREAFNTPLYPMVLVANEVMQEGLDLHHHCRHVVHHDLAWNPAQLEQRVGRVDRLGSLVQRMRQKAPDTTLDISLPLIERTIDERLERTVRLRERWLEFLLGSSPRIEEYGLADDPPPPLPERFAEALRVELGPRPSHDV